MKKTRMKRGVYCTTCVRKNNGGRKERYKHIGYICSVTASDGTEIGYAMEYFTGTARAESIRATELSTGMLICADKSYDACRAKVEGYADRIAEMTKTEWWHKLTQEMEDFKREMEDWKREMEDEAK